MTKGRIISDINKRVIIVLGKSELDRILHNQSREKDTITTFKKLGNEVYEIEIVEKAGSLFGDWEWLSE